MERKFKKSLIGYIPKEVEEIINLENEEFEKSYKEYSKDLTAAAAENERLKEELENIKQGMTSFRDSKSILQETLYKAHVEATKELYEAEKRFEDMVENKSRILQQQKDKNEGIKASINKMVNDIEAIVRD